MFLFGAVAMALNGAGVKTAYVSRTGRPAMITPEDSGFSVRVAEQREMAHRLLPFFPALGCVAVTDALQKIVVAAIEHGSFVSDPTLSDQLVVTGVVLACITTVGGFGLLYLKTLSEPPPASPELAPASQPPSTVPGLAELLDNVQLGNKLEASTAWCMENGVNHVGQLESSLTAGERNGRNGFDRSGVGVELVIALWPSLKTFERKRLLKAIHIRHELAQLLASVELSDQLGSATAWCLENGVNYVAQLDEWGDIRAEFVEMLSLSLAKRGRLLEAIKAFSMNYVHEVQPWVRRVPVSIRDEDQFLRQVEGAYAKRQSNLRRIDRMFSPPTPASPELAPVPLTPPLPGIAPAPPTQQPLPGLAEVLDLLQMSEELETTSAFCEEHGITHIAKWAGPARYPGGLPADKYTELCEIISVQ